VPSGRRRARLARSGRANPPRGRRSAEDPGRKKRKSKR